MTNYIFHDTQLSFLSWPYSVMITGLLAQVLGKNVIEFETLNGNTSRLAPCRIRLKICAEVKEEAQAHYFRTMLAIPIPVLGKKERNFFYSE